MVHEHILRVRYGETDQMGVVHHPNYLLYMEEARTAYMASLGLPYSRLEKEGVGLPVRKLDLRYRGSATFADELLVITRVERIGAASVTFTYRIERSGEGLLLVTGSTELACVDLKQVSRPPMMLPEELREVLGRAASADA